MGDAPIDPLVYEVVEAAVDVHSYTDAGAVAAQRRLSAVIAAARALVATVRSERDELSSAVDWATEKLETTLAAADGAV